MDHMYSDPIEVLLWITNQMKCTFSYAKKPKTNLDIVKYHLQFLGYEISNFSSKSLRSMTYRVIANKKAANVQTVYSRIGILCLPP